MWDKRLWDLEALLEVCNKWAGNGVNWVKYHRLDGLDSMWSMGDWSRSRDKGY